MTLRLLTYSTLFPNPEQPAHGLFVERRLQELLKSGEVAARVVAPVPWFPFASRRFGSYARFARVPASSQRGSLHVSHPRFLTIPKLGMRLAPALLARGTARCVQREIALTPGPDLIDAHYLYPDGVAAAALGRRLGVPVVLTARGSDVNLIGQYELPRRLMLEAIQSSAATVTVSAALADKLRRYGAPPEKITVVRNGVDLQAFSPVDAHALRQRLAPMGPLVLSVGKLDANKGHDLAIDALLQLPGVVLAIAGEGPLRVQLEQHAVARGVADRVRFLGVLSPEDLREHYSAADLLILASEREGLPNVVLEAMACGLPAVATDVGGIAEVLAVPQAGVLLSRRSAAAVADGIRQVLEQPRNRQQVRLQAERFGWKSSIDTLLGVLRSSASTRPGGRGSPMREDAHVNGAHAPESDRKYGQSPSQKAPRASSTMSGLASHPQV